VCEAFGDRKIAVPLMLCSLSGPACRVVRKAVAPVLIVKRRVQSRYHRLVAATDLSEGSRVAMRYGGTLFSDSPLKVLHCFEPLPRRLTDGRTFQEARHQIASDEFAQFMYAADFP